MPSSLPLLCTAMSMPCLNTFLKVISTSFYIFRKWFLSCFFWVTYLLWRLTTLCSRCQWRTRVNSTRFSRLWSKQPQKSTPDGEKRSLWRSASLVPRKKAWEWLDSAMWLLRLRMRTIILNGVQLQGQLHARVPGFRWWEQMKLGRSCGIVDLRAEKCSLFALKAQWVLKAMLW